MSIDGLKPEEILLISEIFRRHPKIDSAILFGSRAKGTHSNRSDVDLAVSGDISSLEAEAITSDLDELPLPYRFEVQALKEIKHRALMEHIKRVGIIVYSKNTDARNRRAIGYGE